MTFGDHSMPQIILKNARIFDGINAECPEGMAVLVADRKIQEISNRPILSKGARVIDLRGRTLMPGMIDAHIHAFTSDVSPKKIELQGEAYRTAHAVRMLGHALRCGFTTVRDVGGGNYSLYRALDDGLIEGPRFFYAGRILSMSGGHGDMRKVDEQGHYGCGCGDSAITTSISVIADGVDACIRATREELRQGAHCVKIAGSGGVVSPTGPVWGNQYREDEIRAIVNECVERGAYVAAHCHPAGAIRRCVDFGVRTIEHGTLIDRETAEFVAERGAFVVPTMAICFALVSKGRELGFPAESQAKADEVIKQAMVGLEHMRSAGVKIGFGTDLLGSLFDQQCSEFTLRSEVFSPLEILRQATSISAEMMMMAGQLGCVAVGAYADLLVVDGDPLKDISLLAANGRHLSVIVRDGVIVKNLLS
jgi:imidazolonepropionase-like amidohydrolase